MKFTQMIFPVTHHTPMICPGWCVSPDGELSGETFRIRIVPSMSGRKTHGTRPGKHTKVTKSYGK